MTGEMEHVLILNSRVPLLMKKKKKKGEEEEEEQ